MIGTSLPLSVGFKDKPATGNCTESALRNCWLCVPELDIQARDLGRAAILLLGSEDPKDPNSSVYRL